VATPINTVTPSNRPSVNSRVPSNGSTHMTSYNKKKKNFDHFFTFILLTSFSCKSRYSFGHVACKTSFKFDSTKSSISDVAADFSIGIF